jgi:signal transduction histidine kinase
VTPECAARHIELVVDLEPTLPPLQIDPEQIHQALLNVVKNALEAIDKPDGVVAIRSILRGEAALIEVEDNGCGIAEADRLRIFEPYHTTKFNGTGLGLMVVLRIVTSHGGRLGIDSEVGRGTVFRIALPLDERPVRLLGPGEGNADPTPLEVAPIVGETPPEP